MAIAPAKPFLLTPFLSPIQPAGTLTIPLQVNTIHINGYCEKRAGNASPTERVHPKSQVRIAQCLSQKS